MADPDSLHAFLRGEADAVDAVRRAIERVLDRARLDAGSRSDLVQESMGRVCLAVILGRFRGAASLTTFAESVARRTCLEHLRWLRRRSKLDDDGLPSPARWARPDEELLRREKYQSDIRTFAALPRECQELFALLFVEGLTYRQIAERTGLTESAIRSRVHRCRVSALDERGSTRAVGAERRGPGRSVEER